MELGEFWTCTSKSQMEKRIGIFCKFYPKHYGKEQIVAKNSQVRFTANRTELYAVCEKTIY